MNKIPHFTLLRSTSPFWRTYLLPAFTRKQIFFLSAAWLIALSVTIIFNYYGFIFGIVIIFSASGALSISAPAILITPKENYLATRMALENGGWTEKKEKWVRPQNSSFWENDQVRVYPEQDVIVILGPFFTLTRLKNIYAS